MFILVDNFGIGSGYLLRVGAKTKSERSLSCDVIIWLGQQVVDSLTVRWFIFGLIVVCLWHIIFVYSLIIIFFILCLSKSSYLYQIKFLFIP